MKPRIMIAGALLAWAAFAAQAGPGPNVPTVTPAPTTAPSADLVAAVAPVRAAVAGRPGAATFAAFFDAAADLVERDQGTRLANTEVVRAWLSDASAFYVGPVNIGGQLPGSDKAANDALATALGAEVLELDSANRSKLVAALRAIAWAARQPGGA